MLVEDTIRGVVKDLLRTKGITKRGLVTDINGTKKVPLKGLKYRLSIQVIFILRSSMRKFKNVKTEFELYWK